jgi:hypothetical protein
MLFSSSHEMAFPLNSPEWLSLKSPIVVGGGGEFRFDWTIFDFFSVFFCYRQSEKEFLCEDTNESV